MNANERLVLLIVLVAFLGIVTAFTGPASVWVVCLLINLALGVVAWTRL